MADLNYAGTTMGWNQLISVNWDASGGASEIGIGATNQVFRVDNYKIGVNQKSDPPDYVTGRGDRTAWKKGPIESQGDLSFPFTLSSGINVFKAGANLVKSPAYSFEIFSSAHPLLQQGKVNTCEISCEAESEVKASATIWGIVNEPELTTVRSYGDPSPIAWGPEGTTDFSMISTIGGRSPGIINGVDPSDVGYNSELLLEQIPMFDVCSIEGAPPGMFITGFSLSVDNRLKRNYTMGNGETGDYKYSPLGLNATTISTNQRNITGTITWQSDFNGYVSQILGSGIGNLIIRIANLKFTIPNALWMAEPPSISAGDRITVQSSFAAMGSGEKTNTGDLFDALIIEDNDDPPPNLA